MTCTTTRAARLLYTLALCLLLPYIFLRLAWRARKQPEYLRHIGERFGFYARHSAALSSTLMGLLAIRLSPQAGKSLVISRNAGEGANESLRDFHIKPVIWLHAVSVGETRATVSLIARLHAGYPGHQILLTHTTPTGRETGTQLYGDGVLRVYLPYDYPFAVQRFLRHFRPQLGILMETEIWFNLIHSCDGARVPLLLLNARMSEKSARGYARFAQLTRSALQELVAIAAQTGADAERLKSLGATQVTVMGNLKFDIEPPPAMLELGKNLRQQFGAGRKVFLAASTREGEEALLLDAWQQQDLADAALLVIVPRHPQRFDEVVEMLAKRQLRFQRRSENKPVAAEVQVVLGDSMGEMFGYYAAADLAFIGGSLLPFGGQNLIEACAVGTPVLIGPHTYNFADATRLAVEAGAALRVTDATELIAVMQRVLGDANALAEMRTQGLEFVAAHRGATDKAMAVIEQVFSRVR